MKYRILIISLILLSILSAIFQYHYLIEADSRTEVTELLLTETTFSYTLFNQVLEEHIEVGDEGGIMKYGLDPQEGPMRDGDIDATEQDPANYAKVWTAAGRENRGLVIECVRVTWKSFYQKIADVLNKGTELAVKPEDRRKVIQVYDAALQSDETGQTVRL